MMMIQRSEKKKEFINYNITGLPMAETDEIKT